MNWPRPAPYLNSVIIAKDDSRADLEQLIRRISGQLQKSPLIDNAQRAALGLTSPDSVRSLIPPPATAPLLTIDAGHAACTASASFQHRLSPLRRGKPKNAIGIDLRLCLMSAGEPIPSDPARYVFLQLATRSPARVSFSGEDAGRWHLTWRGG